MRILAWIFFVATIGLAPAPSSAATPDSAVSLTDATAGVEITTLEHFRTTDREMDIFAVQRQKFESMRGGRSLGYDRAVHWFRFELINRSSQQDWLVEVGFAPLDHIEFYSLDVNGKWSLQFSGDMYSISSRIIRNRHVVFPFFLKRDTRETYYLKVVTTSALQVPVSVWSVNGFRDHSYYEQFANGIFYGIMLIMVFYNLFLYFFIRDRTVLYYVLTLIAGTNVVAYFQGYGFLYLNPESPGLNEFVAAFASPFFIVSSVALTRSFLDLKRFSFWLDRLLLAVAVVSVIFGMLTIGLSGYISYLPMRLLALLNFVFMMAAAVYCFIRKYRPARYFLLAWATLVILGILLDFRNLGLIDDYWILDNALYIGCVMQTLLISFALGDKIQALQKENAEAQHRALTREQEEKERLEREVHARTEEIRQKNSQLEEGNSVKDKLLSLISHDVRSPLIALQGVLDMQDMNSLSQRELQKLLERIGDRLHYTSDFLDNLLQWSRLQMSGEKFEPIAEPLAVHQMLVSATSLIRAECERKGIRLVIDVPGDYQAFADRSMMQTVIRNLVSNAVKFTPTGGRIVVTAALQNNFVAIQVTDSGVGIAQKQMSTLFTLAGVTTAGTQEEKGTGIGLVICKEFVERNGGSIHATSTVGVGTTFEFTIPGSAAQ